MTSWLQAHGFQSTQAAKGRTVIEFSGTAAQLQQTFHTTIHQYLVNGEEHWANANDPQIPAALAPVVAGVATLHNFLKQPQIKISNTQVQARPEKGSEPRITFSDGTHALTPADYGKIYNISPVLSQGIAGQGITIAVLGRSNLFNGGQDVTDFHVAFHVCCGNTPPNIILNGPDPGDLGGGEEAEATLDNTWAGALASNATVDFVLSATTNTTDGIDLSEVYAIDNNVAPILTESFSICEQAIGSTESQSKESLAEQAAAQGITYFVSSGDSGAAGCDDPNTPPAVHSAGVNALASTRFTVAVGGTQFNENGQAGTYWASTNNADGSSVLRYIPENVWNESGATLGLWSSGGGASTVFPKPSWQSGVTGIPTGNARYVPDVSLTAAGHDAYLLCLEGSCVPDSQGFISLFLISGTSASAPSFASIMALVDQKMGVSQGQADYVLYRLAAAETGTLAQCNASGPPQSNCVFNDVTVGNNSVPGLTGFNAAAGYDLATGLGSVNVGNLVNAWNSATFNPTTTTLQLNSGNPVNVAHGTSLNVTISVAPNSGTGTPKGDVSLVASTGPEGSEGVEFFALTAGTASSTTALLPGGNYSVHAHYEGDGTFAPSDSSPPFPVIISAEPTTTTLSVLASDQTTPFTNGSYGTSVYLRADVAGPSGKGTPTGTISFNDNLGSIPGNPYVLNSEGNTVTPNGTFTLNAGSHSLVAHYGSDASFNSSDSAAANFTITQAPTTTVLSSSSNHVGQGASVTLTATITSSSLGNPPGGTVAFVLGTTQIGSAPTVGSTQPGTAASATASLVTTTLPVGQDSISAQYTGEPNYTGSTSTPVTVGVEPDFTVSVGAPTIQIRAPGASGNLTITIASNPGYNSTINFTSASCTGLPPESQCSFNPPSLTGSGQTTLTVATRAPSRRSAALSGFERWATGMGFVFAGVVLLGISPKRRQWSAVLCLAVCASMLMSSSCGGSSNGGGGGGDPGTPPGTYIASVTATTTTGLSHSIPFAITVGP